MQNLQELVTKERPPTHARVSTPKPTHIHTETHSDTHAHIHSHLETYADNAST